VIREINVGFWLEDVKEMGHYKDAGADGRVILR
jgi:hypothetical protein